MRSSCLTDYPSMCLTSLWTWLSNSSRRWRRLSRWRALTSWRTNPRSSILISISTRLPLSLLLWKGLQDFMSQHWPDQVLIVGASTPEMCFCVMCKGNLRQIYNCTCLNPMQWNIWVRRPSLYLKPTVPNISKKIYVTHHHIHQSECVWIYIFCTVSYWNKLGSEQITQGHHDDSHTASNIVRTQVF